MGGNKPVNRTRNGRIPIRRYRERAFTLLEIVVALAVMAVAVSIIVTLYQASAVFAAQARELRIATDLAQERLVDIKIHPSHYRCASLSADAPVEIEAADKTTSFDPPKSLPPNQAAGTRELNAYQMYSWRAFAKLPQADSNLVELTVVVSWQSLGRNRSFALTTYAPKQDFGGAA